MDHGRVVEVGTPAEIMNDPKETRTRHFLRTVLTRSEFMPWRRRR